MKKLFKISALSLLTVLLVTGCGMKAEYGIKIGKDKDVSLEFLVAQDDEMIDAMLNTGNSFGESDTTTDEEKTYTDSERWAYIDSSDNDEGDFKDFDKVKYDKDGYKGYTYTLNLGDIDNLVAEDSDAIDFENIGKDAKLFTKKGDTYKLNVKVSDDDSQQMKQYNGSINFDVTLKVTLPNKAKKNNATKVDGNTYIWDLTKAKSIDLEFAFDGSSSDTNKILYIGIGVGTIVAIGAAAVIISKKKNK